MRGGGAMIIKPKQDGDGYVTSNNEEKRNAKHAVIIANKRPPAGVCGGATAQETDQFILSARLENTHAIAAASIFVFLRFQFTQPVGQIDLGLARWAQHNSTCKAFHLDGNLTGVKQIVHSL